MIPKIIHQLWIGDKPSPTKFMDTWRDKNPDFEYIRWNEQEIKERNIEFECQNRIDEMTEINGKADIMRWELLYRYGGVFIDADSICIEPIDDVLMETPCFAGWENEQARPGLIATGTMGFPPKDPFVKKAIEWMRENSMITGEVQYKAWYLVGPGLMTRIYNQYKGNNLVVQPSYYFLLHQ